MSGKLQMKGLTELRQALREMPRTLTQDAQNIVDHTAILAQHEIQNAYPQGPTGNLKRGVTRTQERGTFLARAIVRSRAPHATIFERGTTLRRTRQGWNRGRMPPAPSSQRMIPIVIRRRRQMVEALKALVRRAGFQVS